MRPTSITCTRSVATFPAGLGNDWIIIAIALIALFACGCSGSGVSREDTEHRYALYVRSKDGREYLHTVSDLASGYTQPVTDGWDLEEYDIGRELIVNKENFYHFSYPAFRFTRYQLEKKGLVQKNILPLPDFSLENFLWLSEDKLLLLGLDSIYQRPVYTVVRPAEMKEISRGTLPLPPPDHGENSMSIGFVHLRGDTLLMGYNYMTVDRESYSTSDSIWIAVLHTPSMKLLELSAEPRSAYPGGLNTIQPYCFTDERGDFYFISSPGILLGHRDDRPTAIFRIAKDAQVTDATYMIDVTKETGDNGYGMWYLGNGRAVVRTEKKGTYTGWNDYHNVHQFSFYTVDLATGLMTRLPLPLDKGGRRDAVRVEGDRAFISVNSTTEGNFIWVYNLHTGKLTQGLEVEDKVDYIFRIDALF